MELKNVILGLLFLIPTLGLWVASLILVIKRSSIASILMIIGVSGELLFSIYNRFLIPALMQTEIISYKYYEGFGYMAVQLVQLLFSLMFVAGLLIHVLGMIKKNGLFQ